MNIKRLIKTYNNPSMTMKLKSSIIVVFTVFVLFFLGGITKTQAQGIFNADDKKVTDIEKNQPLGNGGGGIFRAPPDGSGDGKDPEPGHGDDPVGEGILILSLLSGAYALVRRNVKRKNEV